MYRHVTLYETSISTDDKKIFPRGRFFPPQITESQNYTPPRSQTMATTLTEAELTIAAARATKEALKLSRAAEKEKEKAIKKAARAAEKEKEKAMGIKPITGYHLFISGLPKGLAKSVAGAAWRNLTPDERNDYDQKAWTQNEKRRTDAYAAAKAAKSL